ncbi:hypothetical protein evm_009799 [Chilo suppressalis]|nr:hypothetical protein evm_009799 [Chilo suppressalis]
MGGGTWAPRRDPAKFLTYLTDADVFCEVFASSSNSNRGDDGVQYCGHGDGCHFANGGANGAGVEGATGARAIAILSGCGSVRLQATPARCPPAAAHHHLHVAGSPMVVGMLWEVTDLEVDKMVSTLVSLCVPSEAPLPWPQVGKQAWNQGVLDTEVESKGPVIDERDLLRAMCRGEHNVLTATALAFPMSRIMRMGHYPSCGRRGDWWVLKTSDPAGAESALQSTEE